MVNAENCHITYYPAPVLATPAGHVEKIDDNIRCVVEKMVDIMLQNKGIGFAGPQAAVPLQIFVICLDGNKENVKVYINPTIATAGSLEPMEEGCLSLPGIHVKVRRYNKCTVTATDLDGNEFTQEAEGLLARAFQHEYDHLQGMLIINRIGQIARMAIRRKLKELKETFKNQSNKEL